MDLCEIAGSIISAEDDVNAKDFKEKIDLCLRLRKLANLDRIRLDTTEHSNKLNRTLFSYLKLCGKDPLQFIKEYIGNLHPFMIERRKSMEYKDTVLCVLDKYYSVSIYIKIDAQKMEEVIVSFHESHIKGISKLNFRNAMNERVPVIANEIVSHIDNTDLYTIEVRIQRGVLVVPIKVSAKKKGNVYYVIYSDIERELVGLCNTYIEDVYSASEDLNINAITMFSTLQQLSFPSYGKDILSTLSVLIDSFYAQSNAVSRNAADFAIVTYTRQLLVDERQKSDIIDVLRDKFSIQAKRGLDEIIDRIVSNLDVVIDTQESE